MEEHLVILINIVQNKTYHFLLPGIFPCLLSLFIPSDEEGRAGQIYCWYGDKTNLYLQTGE